MTRTTLGSALLIFLLLSVGCIVSDRMTTLTVNPDGSAELVSFRSNVRSTLKGDRADKELAEYRKRFDTQGDADMARIRDVGGEILKTVWVRDDVPYSNVMHARFSDASQLEKYCSTVKQGAPAQITTQFRSDGLHRSLVFQVTLSSDALKSSLSTPSSLEESRKQLANGISEYRIAVVNGSITAARGFTVATDKQSALLNLSEILELLNDGQGQARFSIEWEVAK